MDMEDFMTGIGTEMIKLINIPLPKGIHDDLSSEGFKAFTTVDALCNARLQRLHADLSDRNIVSIVMGPTRRVRTDTHVWRPSRSMAALLAAGPVRHRRFSRCSRLADD